MALDPQAKAVIDLVVKSGRPAYHTLSPKDARDISQPAMLLDIVQHVGLSADSAREVLQTRTFKDAVDADWDRSRQSGITGVPTFVAGRYSVMGAQPYEALEQLVRKAAQG